MEIKPVKISYPILSLSKLTIKFHVKIYDQNNYRLHSEFNFENRDYLRVDCRPYVTLDPVSEDNTWVPGKSLILTNKNIFSVIRGLTKAKNVLYEKDVFGMRHNELVLYNDVAEENKVVINIPFTKQAMAIKAAVVRGIDDITYEGVIVFINGDSNFVYLTIDELESVIYNLTHVDFVTYSQSLLNYYMQYYGVNVNNPLLSGQADFVHKSRVSFDDKPTSKAESNFVRNTSDEFDNMLAGQ